MQDAYHVISIPVKSLACLALAQELHRCAAVNVVTVDVQAKARSQKLRCGVLHVFLCSRPLFGNANHRS